MKEKLLTVPKGKFYSGVYISLYKNQTGGDLYTKEHTKFSFISNSETVTNQTTSIGYLSVLALLR